MIVSVAVEGRDGLARVLLLVVVDERETLALTGDLVLGEVDASDASERLEQFLKNESHHINNCHSHHDLFYTNNTEILTFKAQINEIILIFKTEHLGICFLSKIYFQKQLSIHKK